MAEEKDEVKVEEQQEPNTEKTAEPVKPEVETAAEKTFTQAEVNEIIESRLARERKKAADEKSEAEKLAKMSAEEKADYQLKKLQQELEALKTQNARAEMVKTARSMLRDEGVDISDELVSFIVADKAETTKENVKAFSTAYKRDLDQAVQEALKGRSPKIGTSKPLSKADILQIKDPMERKQAIAKHLDLFE